MGKSSFKSWWLFSLACIALSSLTGLFFWWGSVATSAPASTPTAAGWNYASYYQSQVGDNLPAQAALTPAAPATPPTTRPIIAQPDTQVNTQPDLLNTQPAGGSDPVTITAAITSDWDKAQLITNEYSRMLASNEIPGPAVVEAQPSKAAVAVVTVRAGTGQYNPIGPPTISLETFAYFLKKNNSPAYPEAASMYQNCIKLSCDPAVALAFFNHESSMGTMGAAVGHKSFGNIRCTAGWPCDYSGGGGGFKIYSTWTEGLIDWAILLKDVYAAKFQLYTLEQIIPVYAPAEDHNQPVVYINTVKSLVDQYRAYRP
ncbi:MAG: glucosaminidase domain-containing protein [Chloroflexi bacterium]|nr:glucosaminidase domain-containing protein [Chloroflexota bacterium]OJV92573.1 MAG: hypothetical protein BGO39_32240 [Chloroflexi bacterium 54-19]